MSSFEMPPRNKRKRTKAEEARMSPHLENADLDKVKGLLDMPKIETLRSDGVTANGSWPPPTDMDPLEFSNLLTPNTKSETLTTPNYFLQVFESLERMAKTGELCDLELGVNRHTENGTTTRVYFSFHSPILAAKSKSVKDMIISYRSRLNTSPNGSTTASKKGRGGKISTKATLLKKEYNSTGKQNKGGSSGALAPPTASSNPFTNASKRLPTGTIRVDFDDKHIDYETMCFLQKYCYSGVASLSQEIVFRVLNACCLFGIPDGIELCEEYLKQYTDVHNAIHVILIASQHNLRSLEESALEFIDSNFESVCETKAWAELDARNLQKIVSRDTLYVREEAAVFHALASWSQHTVHSDSTAKPEKHSLFESMVTKPEYLRLANMSREELIHVSQSSIVSNSPVLRRALYDEAMSRVKKDGGQAPQLRLRNYYANHLSCAGSGTRYPIYNIQTCEQTLTGHKRAVCAVAIAGNHVISGSGDSTIRVWDANTWNCVAVLEGHSNSVVALKVFDNKLVSASPDKMICVWNMNTWQLDRRLTGHRGAVCALAICSNDRLASGSDDGQLKIWNCHVWHLERTILAHSHVIWSLASCRDFVISGSSDTTIKVWDVNSWTAVTTLTEHKDEVQALAVSDDSMHLFSGSDDGVIIVWDTNSWQPLSKLEGHNRAVLSLAVYGPEHLVSGLGNGVVKIWNINPLSSCVELAEHGSCVMAVAVYKGKVISASYDKSVKIWGP